MKKNYSYFGMLLALICALLLVDNTAPAQNVGSSAGYNMFSNVVTLRTATTNPVNSIAIPIRRDQGFSLFATYNETNTVAAVVAFFLSVSPDGTNWSTTTIPMVTTANGTNAIIAYSNYPPSVINNAQYVKITSITNGPFSTTTNWIYVTNVVLSYF